MTLPPVWIVLKRPNGHFEGPTGPTIQSFTTEGEAIAFAEAQAKKFPGSTISWFRLAGQFQPRDAIERVTVDTLNTGDADAI